jgi:glycosyltransferase involved in cell wall biosynthesis
LPISAVIISHDAASRIGQCLASVSFCDEIIVVDSGSSDGTVDLARSAGARVIEQPWLGYGPQKQIAVQQAAFDWVLCLDTDEAVSESLRSSIQMELAAPQARARVFAVARCNRFLGRWLRHGEGYPDWSVRLFHRAAARWSDDAVHEKVLTSHPVARLRGDLLHDSAETLESYLEKQSRYTSLQAERLYKDGCTVTAVHLLLSPLARFFKLYCLRMGFLDGLPGLIHVCIGCMNSFTKYAKVLALQKASPQ